MPYFLIALLVALLAACSQADDTLPQAQTGSLYPFLRATADRSELPLSFLQPRFRSLEAWKREGRKKVHELGRFPALGHEHHDVTRPHDSYVAVSGVAGVDVEGRGTGACQR